MPTPGATRNLEVRDSVLGLDDWVMAVLAPPRHFRGGGFEMRSRCRVGVHLVWATKRRHPWLVEGLRPRVFEVLGDIAHRLHSSPIAIGGWVDHVHVYVMLSRQTTISALVNALKAHSTTWVRRTHPDLIAFEWQRGYSAAGVDPRDDDALRSYIQNQEQIHRFRNSTKPGTIPTRNCVVVG